jgi:transposase
VAVDATGMPIRVIVTEGTRGDCTEALPLIDGMAAEALMADKAYDTDAILSYAQSHGIDPVIPPKKNRKDQRDYDTYLYRLRHLVENAILDLKGWRGVATRYAKNAASFLAIVQIRCAFLWANIS